MALSPPDHEEADTRLLLHVKDMERKGLSRVMIRTVDTDMFLLSISLYDDLDLEQIWIDFGSGEQRCFLPIHEMVLDPLKRDGLGFFFAFTGCDQVSFFAHVTKATAWKVWSLFPAVNLQSSATIQLMTTSQNLCLCWNDILCCSSIAHQSCKGRAIDNIPQHRMLCISMSGERSTLVDTCHSNSHSIHESAFV